MSFNYDSSNDIFKNINFTIKSGEAIGIIGPSGSGKSTLADLILGFIKPTEGKILLNDMINLDNTSEFLRNKSAYLPQQIFLINGSIKENIALGEDKIDIEKIIESTRKSQLINFIDSLENKLDTNIGEGGSLVSGGSKTKNWFGKDLFILIEKFSFLMRLLML